MNIRRKWRSLWARIGNRGDALLFLGFVDFVQAISMVNGSAVGASYAWFEQVMPLPAWAAIWGAMGVVCVYHAFRDDDHFGFVAAIGIKVVWGIGSFAAFIWGDVTPLGAVLWFVFARFAWRISQWPEPIKVEGDPL